MVAVPDKLVGAMARGAALELEAAAAAWEYRRVLAALPLDAQRSESDSRDVLWQAALLASLPELQGSPSIKRALNHAGHALVEIGFGTMGHRG